MSTFSRRGKATAPDITACQDLLEQFDHEFNDYVAFAKEQGPEALNALLERLGGQKVHVPTLVNFWTGLQRQVRNEDMRARFRGNNYKQLAIEYGVSEREARRIIHCAPRKYSPKTPPHRPVKLPDWLHAELAEIVDREGVTFSKALEIRMSQET